MKRLIMCEGSNELMADQGWILQQVVTPADGVGAMIGIFYKERKL